MTLRGGPDLVPLHQGPLHQGQLSHGHWHRSLTWTGSWCPSASPRLAMSAASCSPCAEASPRRSLWLAVSELRLGSSSALLADPAHASLPAVIQQWAGSLRGADTSVPPRSLGEGAVNGAGQPRLSGMHRTDSEPGSHGSVMARSLAEG